MISSCVKYPCLSINRRLCAQVACLILVDRGVLSPGDPALIHTKLPELSDREIFKGFDEDDTEMFASRNNRDITLRILLSHTSGK